MIEITYLDIECNQMSVRMLITILKRLTNLKSIRISNSLLRQMITLHMLNNVFLQKFFNINKITKITLQNVIQPKQIDFIFKHFHRLEFFQFYFVKGKNLLTMMEYILRNIKINYIIHPITICVVCDHGEYIRMEQLYYIIDSKNLFNNFSIYHQQERLYVQFK